MQHMQGHAIWVGLSGGVDSAVSAALLKDAGAQVTGVFIKGWYPPGLPCSWAEERRDAMRVAAHLRIPFKTVEAGDTYKRSVVDHLLREYRAGRTPNPDVWCNRDIKFGVFYETARLGGAETIATGHYRSGEKDQSYFLWAVPKDILEATLFPVGWKSKEEVRSLAKRYALPVATKRDSQGICFLGSVSVDEWLRQEFGVHPGRAVDETGREVGVHDGTLFSTIGQRVSLRGAPQGPWYVRSKDLVANELIVAQSVTPPVLSEGGIRFTDALWHRPSERATSAQYRYRGPRVAGRVSGDSFLATTPPIEPLATGQSLVFFEDDALVGGGIIAG